MHGTTEQRSTNELLKSDEKQGSFIDTIVHTQHNLDGNPGTRAPGHRIPGPWSQGIFLFYFFNFFGGSSFFSQKYGKKHCCLSVFSLFLSLFLSFSVHTLWVLLSLMNFTKLTCEGKLKKGVTYKLQEHTRVLTLNRSSRFE